MKSCRIPQIQHAFQWMKKNAKGFAFSHIYYDEKKEEKTMSYYIVCWRSDLAPSAVYEHLKHGYRQGSNRRYCLVEAVNRETVVERFLRSEFKKGRYFGLQCEIGLDFVTGAINDAPLFDEGYSKYDELLKLHNRLVEIIRTESAEEEVTEEQFITHELVKQFFGLLTDKDKENYWIEMYREFVVTICPNSFWLRGEGKVFMFDLEESLNRFTEGGLDFEQKDLEDFHPYIVQDRNLSRATERFLNYLYESEDKKRVNAIVKRDFIVSVCSR